MLIALSLLGCGGDATNPDGKPMEPAQPEQPAGPGAADAEAFVKRVDQELRERWTTAETAHWTLATDITDAHEKAAAEADEATMAYMSATIPEAKKFADVEAPADVKRQIHLLKQSVGLPAPSDATKRARLAEVTTKLGSMYGKGKWCPDGSDADCLDLTALEKTIGDVALPPAEREAAWTRWREVSKPMKPLYEEFVSLGNEGAADLGYADMGDLWRSGYDMEPAEFEGEIRRLYSEVSPLYEALHCHVRAHLNDKYPEDVGAQGPIPAHLLGNMWAQDWDLLYGEMVPYPDEPSLDVTAQLQAQQWDAVKMTRTAEAFFVGLGLDPLPDTFWERSMLEKPTDREVECHASAWDPGYNDDLRIKMCIQPTQEDLYTLHHELGHNYYFHYYHQLPVLFQSGAHDGFHEAVGDAIMLSVKPEYLKSIGLLEEASTTREALINQQLKNALGAVAFLPFGRMIDQWRWDVFSGKVPPEQYNTHWWALRTEFQGITPPGERAADAFDPGAKYHIPGNTPYMRYFLAQILQYQFYRGMCEAAGHTGPLHTCSFEGSKEAGDRLEKMLAMGASRPWPDALEVIAGTRKMSAEPLIEYYAPLMEWLAEQNEGRTCGW